MESSIQIDSATRIIDLNVGQLSELVESLVKKVFDSIEKPREKEYARSVKELAEKLGVSVSTANKIKTSGVIDDATVQFCRTFEVDVDKARKLIQEKRRKDAGYKRRV